MLNYLLYNKSFELIISTLFFITFIITSVVEIKFSPKKEKIIKEKKDKNVTLENKINNFKDIIFDIYLLIVTFIIIIFLNKYKLLTYIYFLDYLYVLYLAFKMRKKNIGDLSYDSKMHFIKSTVIYVLFFSNSAVKVYFNYFSFLNHSIKEYLLLIFLISKMIFFIYSLTINISILLLNIKAMLRNKSNVIKMYITNIINKKPTIILYNFYMYKKHKRKIILVLDFIIYLVTCPFLILFNIVYIIIMKIYCRLLKIILITNEKISFFLNNSSKAIENIIRIATIITLIATYIIIMYKPKMISKETKDIYTLLITVVLIPLIYDGLKSNKKSKKDSTKTV